MMDRFNDYLLLNNSNSINTDMFPFDSTQESDMWEQFFNMTDDNPLTIYKTIQATAIDESIGTCSPTNEGTISCNSEPGASDVRG